MRIGKSAWVLTLFMIICGRAAAWAGPPFQTDDPEPIDYKNYEFYTFGSADGTALAMNSEGPAAEFNWGALPNVHLHIILPLAAIFPSNNPKFAPSGCWAFCGWAGRSLKLGVKFRIRAGDESRIPQIGTFVMF